MKPLTLNDTSVLKGIAILLMLCHHVFAPEQTGLYSDLWLHGKPVLSTFALDGKECVAIFVFLSGYGLMTRYGSQEHLRLRSFYWKRFVKLMMNYWFVWLIFVPLSVFFLSDKPFGWWYYVNHKSWMGILDFLGIANWFGSFPYNPAWWFYSCIIGLYLLFPLLRWLVNRSWLCALTFCIAFFFIPGPLGVVRQYLPAFVCGMLYANSVNVSQQNQITPPMHNVWLLVNCIMLAFIYVERKWVHNPILFDALIVTFGVYVYQQIVRHSLVKRVLAFFGKYSMDMFLTHSFIFSLWPVTRNIVYATSNPMVIYLSLVVMSLVLAMLLGRVKNVTGYNKFIKLLRNKTI